MTPEVLVLCAAAASIAFVHTLLGPDHYMPFVALSRSRGWSLGKTVRVTFLCGAGHIVGSVLLGLIGLYIGMQLNVLEWVEGVRGDLAAWALVAFGIVYMSWGIRQAYRKRPHTHWHTHDGVTHRHVHAHEASHAHPHAGPDAIDTEDVVSERRALVGWAIFIIFVLGPCEPLIPLLMFPAAAESLPALIAVTTVFAVVTVGTMLAAVVAGFWGTHRLHLPGVARFGQAIAGGVILSCGLAISVLGL